MQVHARIQRMQDQNAEHADLLGKETQRQGDMADRAVPALTKDTHSWNGGERAASG